MVDFANVDVKDIKSDRQRSSFPSDKVEDLANLILEAGELIRPITLKQTGLDSYDVIDGHLEYFAAVRAREKNPRDGETVNAFVFSKRDENIAYAQLRILNEAEPSGRNTNNSGSTDNSDWISSFENRLGEIREKLFQETRSNESRIAQLEKNLKSKQKANLLDFINSASETDLVEQLSRYGIAAGKVEAICDARRQNPKDKFSSYQELVKATRGLGASGMLNLLDAWARASR